MKAYLRVNDRLKVYSLQKVAIVRALPGLGDLLCAVPALRALRTAIPNAEITLIGLPAAKGFVRRFSHYLDRWLEFPGYPGIPEVHLSPSRTINFFAKIQPLNFDLALQMHGNGMCMNGFTALLNARISAGFFLPGHYCPSAHYFLPYPDHEPEIRRHLHLMQLLGIPLQGEELEFPLEETDWHEWNAIAHTHRLRDHNYVCIHPGASVQARRWSYQHFAAIADVLAAKGLPIVLTGTAAEAELNQAVCQHMQFPAINLAGQTSLGGLATLLKQACLLICNDTGVSHLAAALRVKSVVVFSNSDPRRWAPLDRQRHRIVQVVPEYESDQEGRSINGALHHPSTPLNTVLKEAIALIEQEVSHAS